MNDSEFLSPAELHDLTGYARGAEQAAWLAEHDIPHYRDRSRVICSRFHARAWLEGRTVVTSAGPDWSQLNA